MSWYAGVVADLRSSLARLLALDLWPPTEVARTIGELAAGVLRAAAEPPRPDPADLAEAGERWLLVESAVDRAGEDLAAVSRAVGPAVWSGRTADGFRGSLHRLTARIGTVGVASSGAAAAITTLGDAMTDARARHARGVARIRSQQSLGWSWSDLDPFALRDRLVAVVEDLVAGLADLVGAYEDADAAVGTARRSILDAVEGIELPTHLPEAGHPSAITVVNGWDGRHGPLHGPALRSYDHAWARLSPGQQRAVQDALAGARSGPEQAWVLAAVGAGLSGPTLRRYLGRLRSMTPAEVATLEPTTRLRDPGGHPFRQPDPTTCGSASLVLARMLDRPAYAMRVLTGYDPATGEVDPGPVGDRFASEALAMHERTNGLRDAGGGWQVPWPQALGTQPWAVARAMSTVAGVPGSAYAVTLVDPHDRGPSYDAVARASDAGHPVPVFVGDDLSPRHVMLVTAADEGGLTVYDPADGREVVLTRRDWTAGALPTGWKEPWAVVTPSS